MGSSDAASYLGITPRTLYRLIDAGEVPAFRIGRVIRLKRADLDAFIEGSRITPGSLEHLHPEPKPPAATKVTSDADSSET